VLTWHYFFSQDAGDITLVGGGKYNLLNDPAVRGFIDPL
jgi:hypothetical protein